MASHGISPATPECAISVPRYNFAIMKDCAVAPVSLGQLMNHLNSAAPIPVMGNTYADANVFCSVCSAATHAPNHVILCQYCYTPVCISDAVVIAGTHIDDAAHYPLVNTRVLLKGHVHIFPMRVASCLRCVAERAWNSNRMYTHPRLASPSVNACLRQWQTSHMVLPEAERVAFYVTLNAYSNAQQTTAELQDRVHELEQQVQRLQQQATTTPPPSPPSFDSFVDMYNRAFCEYDKKRAKTPNLDAIHGHGLFPGPGSSPMRAMSF